jgi:hypothetical protein
MQSRELGPRLTAMAALAAFALLGLAPDRDVAKPVLNPAIIDITFSPPQIRAGKTFEVTIHTTPDVMSMQAHVLKYNLSVPKTGNGLFSASARVPWWAAVYHGTFHVMFVAFDASGEQAQMEADVRI